MQDILIELIITSCFLLHMRSEGSDLPELLSTGSLGPELREALGSINEGAVRVEGVAVGPQLLEHRLGDDGSHA